MTDSRIKGFYKRSLNQRIEQLVAGGWLTAGDAESLRQGRHTLLPATADKMIENVVGVFGLPLAIAPNFQVNGKDYLVPMVVEEASIVAGASMTALLARKTGGFTAVNSESLLIGQVHVSGLTDSRAAVEKITAARDALVAAGNAAHPRLIKRGGGVRDIEVHELPLDGVIAVHLLVDTRDAMGANLVNTMCEAVAPVIADVCGGNVALRILSNLADRSIVTARATFKVDDAARDGIVLASDIARADPYRAATHNKGIMNGVDAVAVATGNDWRAIEAGAHAFAAAEGRYAPLATWTAGPGSALQGEIRIPLKVGTVGGNLAANRAAALGLAMSGVESASELAKLMAAVGLAQNFAALNALATRGIQAGHMRLHARSVATSAGVADDQFDAVVDELVKSGDIKVWKARELAAGVNASEEVVAPSGHAAGKIILLGEHAVVYGKHALALPIPNAVAVALQEQGEPVIAELTSFVDLIRKRLGVDDSTHVPRIHSALPIAMGLGASAAYAVALTRAYAATHGIDIDDERVNAIAFECEKLAHGTPSGIDNALATYGEAMLFRNDGDLHLQRVTVAEPPPVVVACSHQAGRTLDVVAGVRARREQARAHFDAIFAQIDDLALAGAEALGRADYVTLGQLMNINQGLLNAIGVSTPELEGMLEIARAAGAVGAKLTGAGGGGSIVALCPGAVEDAQLALQSAGFRTINVAGNRNASS